MTMPLIISSLVLGFAVIFGVIKCNDTDDVVSPVRINSYLDLCDENTSNISLQSEVENTIPSISIYSTGPMSFPTIPSDENIIIDFPETPNFEKSTASYIS